VSTLIRAKAINAMNAANEIPRKRFISFSETSYLVRDCTVFCRQHTNPTRDGYRSRETENKTRHWFLVGTTRDTPLQVLQVGRYFHQSSLNKN